MSSFIVENKTINRIVNFCFWEHDSMLKHYIQKELKELNIDLWKYSNDKDTDNVLKKFGEELLKLNVMAYYTRYKHIDKIEKEIKEAVKEYEYKDIGLKDTQHIQVLKSIQCFLYQCSEGEIDKTPLYQTLRKIENHLKDFIIDKIPEYEKAIWG